METQEVQDKQDDEIVPETEVLQTEYEFKPAALCKYVQRGTYLVCTSCELQHAVHIGIKKIMVGETEHGVPILKDRTFGA